MLMKFLILLVIFRFENVLYAKVLKYEGDDYQNPYIIFTTFKEETIGIVGRSFFCKNKKREDKCELFFYSINRKSLIATKKLQKDFYLEYPDTPKNFEKKFEDYFIPRYNFSFMNKEEMYIRKLRKKEDGISGVELMIDAKKYKIAEKYPNYKSKAYITLAKKIDEQVWFNEFTFGESGTNENVEYKTSEGLNVVNLKTLQSEDFIIGYNPFAASWILLIEKDPFTGLVWIGNNYGLYGLDTSRKEKIACIMVLEKNKKLKDFICQEADYVDDLKKNQIKLLLSKRENLKIGKSKPIDNTAIWRERLEINLNKK